MSPGIKLEATRNDCGQWFVSIYWFGKAFGAVVAPTYKEAVMKAREYVEDNLHARHR